MPYTYSLPKSVAFTGNGVYGYSFGPLKQDLDIYYILCEKGHDTFMISKKITRTYYVLSGNGYFTIADNRYSVSPGMLVEVPPKVEYSYSGKMTLLGVSIPGWFVGNDTHTKRNPDVFGHELAPAAADRSSWGRLVRVKIFGKSPVNAYLRLNQWLWNKLPARTLALRPVRSYGTVLHRLARSSGGRAQAFATHFLRNRPQLELIRRLVDYKKKGETVSVAVLACSTGAEAYSIAWRIRSARPDLQLSLYAMDISRPAVDFAQRGAYSTTTPEFTRAAIFERMTPREMEDFFDRDGETMTVKSWIREGINWHVGDAGDPETINLLGAQDLVVANNFLCHMERWEAEKCLRNIARLVRPNGHLIVSGVDLDLRARVACDLGWSPLEELLEEIHEGDPCMRNIWPCQYAGLEPLDKGRADWKMRYAAGFQLPLNRGRVIDSERGDEVTSAVVERDAASLKNVNA